MRNRFLAAAGSAAAALTLLFSPSAPAATEFGSNCEGNIEAGPLTATSDSVDPVNALPPIAPTGGVITRWRTNIETEIFPGLLSERLVLLRPAGAPDQFTAVARSQAEPMATGANVFAIRIPVQAGDRLALAGDTITLLCQTGKPLDLTYFRPGVLSVGSAQSFVELPAFRVPISALIEPDADNDGFGDETQDQCPQSAVYQVPCPVVKLSGLALPGKTSVSVYIATSLDAPVTVTGTATLGKGRKATLSAAPQTVATGQLTRFVLKFPKRLTAKLAELTPKRKLTLQITAGATNVAGQASTSNIRTKLKGRR